MISSNFVHLEFVFAYLSYTFPFAIGRCMHPRSVLEDALVCLRRGVKACKERQPGGCKGLVRE